MQATVTWQQGLQFSARSESGHETVFDGDNAVGPSPMASLLNALGACSSIDVVMILEKGRQQVTGCRCELKGERAEGTPRVFTRIHAHFVVAGKDLTASKVARAVEMSFDKYCSVSKMLEPTVEITHSHEITAGDE